MSTQKKLAGIRREWCEAQGEIFDNEMRCFAMESPIEQLLLAQMLLEQWHTKTPYCRPDDDVWFDTAAQHLGGDVVRARPMLCQSVCRSGLSCYATCIPQLPVDVDVDGEERSYRIDFAFFAGFGKLVVELDGHDFHERTKEQAQRDKSRDRAMTFDGWTVLRFTGSEVFRDPAKVLATIGKWLDEQHAEEQRAHERAK